MRKKPGSWAAMNHQEWGVTMSCGLFLGHVMHAAAKQVLGSSTPPSVKYIGWIRGSACDTMAYAYHLYPALKPQDFVAL